MSTVKWTKKELIELLDYFTKEYVVGSKIFFTDRDANKLVKILKSIPKYQTSMEYSNHFVINRRVTKGKAYKCLEIKMHNGKKVPITKTAIRQLNNTKSVRSMVLEEMRRIIEPQINAFRQIQLRFLPASMGKIHIDHDEKTFQQLAVEWVQTNGWKNFESVPGHKTRGQRWAFPAEISQDWQEYHKEYATLRVIDAKTNLAESSKGYVSPF